MRPIPTNSRRAGVSLLEVMISLAITTVVLVAVTMSVQHEAKSLSSVARKSRLELSASEMLDRVGNALEYAQGVTPRAFLGSNLASSDEASALVDTTQGFPDQSVLLIDAGLAVEERIRYDSINDTSFLTLERGFGCGDPSTHDAATLVRWAGVAEVIENQVNPASQHYDGLANELVGELFFRGDGFGFTFRNPVDPTGGTDFIDNSGDVRWGASVDGNATQSGWSSIFFEPVAKISEASRGADLNIDGDREDVFELGRIRMRSWDANDIGGEVTDRILCPPIIVQEECQWGSDLNGDGFEDPMFLWNPLTGRLRIRLFLLTGGQHDDQARLRTLESNLFLRNGSES